MKRAIVLTIFLGLGCIFAVSTIDLTTDVRGVLSKSHGGTGTDTPSLQAGSNVTVTGDWPNQTVSAVIPPETVNPDLWLPVDNVKDNGNMCRFVSAIGITRGLLTLTLSNDGPYTCAGYTGVGYSAPMIVSRPFSFQYGVVKARIRFGQPGNTLRSALWMWGGDSTSTGYPPTCTAAIANAPTSRATLMNLCTASSVPSYEIDIAECESSNTTIYQSYLKWVSGGINDHVFDTTAVSNVDSQYHIYELSWNSTTLTFSVDGSVTNTISKPVTVPMFLIIDQEIYNAPTSYPNTTSVDWVNVCSDPTTACNFGDSTTIFSDEFN